MPTKKSAEERLATISEKVYLYFFYLVVSVVVGATIGTALVRFLTGNPTIELIPQSVFTFIIESGKPFILPVSIKIIGDFLPQATELMRAWKGSPTPAVAAPVTPEVPQHQAPVSFEIEKAGV